VRSALTLAIAGWLALGGGGPVALARAPAGTPGMLTPASAQAPSQAETAKLVEQARAHFEAGNQHYAAGRYLESIREFQAGYALVPRPNFLVNLGQAYRKLGDLHRAKESYVAYVRALPQNSALRDQALQVLAEIEVQLQEQKPSAPIPAIEEPGPAPALVIPTTPGDQPARDTAGKTNWLAMGVAGGGLALAGTGLVFQLRAKNASDKLTTLDRNGQEFDPALEQQGRRDQRIGIALLGAGGVALAAAITMYLMSDDQTESPAYAIRPGALGLILSF
jgi:tetratricopeptide (TPR) repeat protein